MTPFLMGWNACSTFSMDSESNAKTFWTTHPGLLIGETANPQESGHLGDRYNRHPEIVILAIFETTSLLISSCILLLVWCHGQLRRNYTNWLVSNACAVMLLGGVFYRWAYIVMAANNGAWTLGGAYCHVMWIVRYTFHLNRAASLFLMTLSCGVFVYDPQTYSKKITEAVTVAMIAVSWVASIIYGLLHTYGFGWPTVSVDKNVCYQSTNQSVASPLVTMLIEYVIPYCALVVTTSVVYVYSWRLHKDATKGDAALVGERQKQAKQAAILTGCINGLYILMTLPVFVVAMGVYSQKLSSSSDAARIAYVISAAYDTCQAILWVILIPDVRFAITWLICICCGTDRAERMRLLWDPFRFRPQTRINLAGICPPGRKDVKNVIRG